MEKISKAKDFKVPMERPEEKHFTRVIRRNEWGALLQRGDIPPLNPPIRRVNFSYHRNWPQCFNQEECSETLRQMQMREMNENGLVDVRHNFMIGADCNVYEGRGWYKKPEPASKVHYLWDDKTIDIGFFAEKPKEFFAFNPQFGLAKEFIIAAIKRKLIDKDWIML